MKLIKPGDPHAAVRWWVGMTLTCQCGRVVQLEEGDENHPAFIDQGALEVKVGCLNCGEVIVGTHVLK